MKIDWLRLYFRLKVLWTPGVWIRIGSSFDSSWDDFLWNSLKDGKIEKLHDKYTARINGITVWICNAPFGNGERWISAISFCRDEEEVSNKFKERNMCSRATALFLQSELKKSMIFLKLKNETFK
jgi:hypothetical protein